MLNNTKVLTVFLLFIIAMVPQVQSQVYEPKQVIDGTEFGGQLGLDMDRSNITLVVGARGANSVFGGVNVYTKQGSQWIFQDSASGDQQFASYGRVAISGDLIVVGAPETDINGVLNVGKVYIYTFDNNTLTLRQTIDGTAQLLDGKFGFSIAVENNTIAVGERRPSPSGAVLPPRVYIYDFDGTVATQRTFFETATPTKLVLKNNILALGARFGGINNSGSVELYEINGLNATLLTTLVGENDGDNFGQDIAFEGNILAVGAPAARVSGVQFAGLGYIYSFDGTNATFLAKFNNIATVQQYGLGVAVGNNLVAFGAPTFNSSEGRVQVFSIDGSTVNLIQTISGSTGQFGDGLNFDGNSLVIGASEFTVGGLIQAGRIYVYSMPGDCYISAPIQVNENQPFASTVTCEEVADVYGFEYEQSVDPSSPIITEQTTTFSNGNIFSGFSTLTLVNNINDGYAQSLQAPETPVSGNFTLGSLTYNTDDPGIATLNLDLLILGNISGQSIPVNISGSTQIIINDLALASISGTARRETGADVTSAITVLADGASPDTIGTAGGFFTFAYDEETVALDATLTVNAPGHVSCLTLDLGLIDDTVNILTPITLLAGDVDNNDTVDITDGSIIVQERFLPGSAPVGTTPDLNEDGSINVLDIIHVGRNFSTVGPVACQ